MRPSWPQQNHIFLEQGFSHTSMDQISKAANVSKKTTYHHYADKSILFQEVLGNHWHDIADNYSIESFKWSYTNLEQDLSDYCQVFYRFFILARYLALF
ncbi:TetR/AcrR family transcriptional regulator [Piscirickettsia litoralis]|uniref:HTH tetR-type domain-containing protein n=1 Tax=Piscirickettsia litoralis TaxID=1891921 RepID=A0ABX2ZZF6_9GAMM|nr:TetR/AcrR family transcriptional regulator [Piscirickettsia litoralis]ODN41942.1 hypothetical protein BGC07_01895 [Piscirickettsia litoralis]